VKLGLLQINCSYKVYKQNYPETYILIQKHNAIACRFISPKRQKLLKWAQERPGFYIAKLILKILLLKSTLKKLYSKNPFGSRNLRINWNGIKKNKKM
jgi:hypothetical protein